MLKMYFNFKDVFRAARLGFSPKKMWVMFCGLLLGIAVYDVFAYLSHLAAGRGVADVWATFGLLPLPWNDFTIWAWLLWGAGFVIFVIIYMLTASVVARIATEQLVGNEFFEIKEGLQYLKQNWKAVLGSPVVITVFALGIMIFGAVLGWWGRIPYLGELTVSLLTVPVYLVCLFLVFLLAALMVALWYVPVISGATKGDTFDNLFETFSAMTSQPWRLVIYTGLLKLVVLAGAVVFGWFTGQALMLAYRVLGAAMGEKFLGLAAASFNVYTPPMVLHLMLTLLQGRGLDPNIYLMATPELNWAGHISVFLMGMSLNLIRLLVASYAAASFVVGQTIIYGIIVMKRDDRNIFEKKEEQPASDMQTAKEDVCETPQEGKDHKAVKAARKMLKTKTVSKSRK
jgi:uncharacterized membrane-anchored protein YhcB (DUF1043 family)